MWPLNFKTENKLNMSIGLGLIVAGFIGILVTQAWKQDIDYQYAEDISNTFLKHVEIQGNNWDNDELKQWMEKEVTHQINNAFNQTRAEQVSFYRSRYSLYSNIILLGMILFICGYFPWLIEERCLSRKRIHRKISHLLQEIASSLLIGLVVLFIVYLLYSLHIIKFFSN